MKDSLVLEPRKKYDYSPDEKIFYDAIIVGGGVVGFSAAMYARRLGMEVLIIGDSFGGTIMFTPDVENWLGFISVGGQKLAKLVENHARDYEIDILKDLILKTKKIKDGFEVSTKDKKFKSKTIIFATGTKLRRLGVSGEGTFAGKGVSYCALCDGMFFKNKIVGVVGGSDSAVKEALFLSEHAKKVYIIYRRENLRPEQVTLKKMNERIKEGKIVVINNANVLEIKGDKFMSHVVLDRDYDDDKNLELDGLFIDIGRVPLSDLAKNLGVAVNEEGEIETDKFSQTSMKGVFACGDVTDFPIKQAFTGSSFGIIASYSAYKYLQNS
jgi:thioredoxin reductase (NADPH)